MSDEPSHKAMLYFLEVLMNSNGPLTISQLAGRFGSPSFTLDMRNAAGGNEAGLKTFLLKYPSLFTIKGNMVSLCDGSKDDDDNASVSSSQDSSTTPTRRPLPDVSVEMDAVQFFQSQLARREEQWVPVKSLAGHLSQTSAEIRNVVGPQLEFRSFLLRHMHIFDVDGEMVCLREGLVPPMTPSRNVSFALPQDEEEFGVPVPPKTPPAQRKNLTKNGLHRSQSFGDRSQLPAIVPKRQDAPVTMTANEYKAVMHVKELLERRGPMNLSAVLGNASELNSESLRTTLGTTPALLESFLRKNSAIFSLRPIGLPGSSDGDLGVDLVKNAKLSVIIVGSRPPPDARSAGVPPPTVDYKGPLHEGKGKIFHVAKLWGIVDLGDHEHVFFDRSIMSEQMDDLQKYFHTGEVLCFKAVPAHKSSRAKWRATHVWREEESTSAAAISSNQNLTNGPQKPDGQIEGEMNAFLPARQQLPSSSGAASSSAGSFTDSRLSGSGVVQIWNFKGEEEKNKRASVCVVPESYQMSASVLNDMKFMPEFGAAFLYGGGLDPSASFAAGDASNKEEEDTKVKKYESVACQTVSTGDIIATQLYQTNN